MFSIKELESDLFFLEGYRVDVIELLLPYVMELDYHTTLNEDEKEERYKLMLNKKQTENYIDILKRYKKQVFGNVMLNTQEHYVNIAINERKVYDVHNDEDIICIYLRYIKEKINNI